MSKRLRSVIGERVKVNVGVVCPPQKPLLQWQEYRLSVTLKKAMHMIPTGCVFLICYAQPPSPSGTKYVKVLLQKLLLVLTG